METNRYHNIPDGQLADEIGRIDSIVKAAEAELTALKDEFKRRELTDVAGAKSQVAATEQIASRLRPSLHA